MGILNKLFGSRRNEVVKVATLIFTKDLTFVIDEPTIFIGRGESFEANVIKTGNSLMMSPLLRSISRKHAMLTKEDNGEYSIVDQGSKYGTFFNGIQLMDNKKVKLENKDRITLGPHDNPGGIKFQILYS